MAERQSREDEMTEYTASLVERTEHVAEQLRSVHEALGGVAVWKAYQQCGALNDAADELERLARRAREVGREANMTAAKYYASKTPDFGEIQHNRLCYLAAARRPLHSMKDKPIEIFIVDDTTLEVDEELIELTAEEITILNRVAADRDSGATFEQLCAQMQMETGDRSVERQKKFRVVLAEFIKVMELFDGDEVLFRLRTGSKVVYRLSPAVQFIDQRIAQSEGEVKDEGAFVDRSILQPEGADMIIEAAEPQTEEDGSTFVVSPQAETLVRVEELQETEEAVVAAQPAEIVLPEQQTDEVGEADSKPLPTNTRQAKAPTAKPSTEAETEAHDPWRSIDEIAHAVGLSRDAVGLFFYEHRKKLRERYGRPQLRVRLHPTQKATILVECYPPEFSQWAIANLKLKKQVYQPG